jgi:spermidine synthase
MTPLERLATRAVVFLGGAMLMALEVAAFRIIGKTFGSALRETTAVIAVFLAAMSIGYWAGGKAGDRWPRPATLVAALLSAAVTLTVIPWLDAALSARIAASPVDLAAHAFIATALLFAIPTFFFASVSPIAVRLFATSPTHSGSIAGSISALSTAGSIAGSVATAFFLIDWLASITRTVIFVAVIACISAAALALASLPRMAGDEDARRRLRRLAIVAAAAAAIIIIPTVLFVRSTRLDYSLAGSGSAKILFTGDSAYHHVTVREWHGGVRELLFNIGVQSRMSTSDPFGPGNAYTDAFHIPRLLRPGLKRVLMIGLGGGTSAKQFSHDYDDVIVDVVEVDPLVVDVAKRYFGVRESDRLRIHVGDGRTFLSHARERWDLIIIDAYTSGRYGDTIPAHLTTREFFTEAAAHLEDGGMLHFHCVFSGTPLLPALEKTIGSVFDSVISADGEIVASNVSLILSKGILLQRAKSGPAARLPHLATYIAALAPRQRNPEAAKNVPLLTDDYAPVDTLVHGKR